jgi:hypothetical protein
MPSPATCLSPGLIPGTGHSVDAVDSIEDRNDQISENARVKQMKLLVGERPLSSQAALKGHTMYPNRSIRTGMRK